jgi:hypothetical protein
MITVKMSRRKRCECSDNLLSIKGDSNSETVKFILNRYVGDTVNERLDLSTFVPLVQVEPIIGDPYHRPIKSTITEENKIILYWDVYNCETQQEGEIKVSIKFVKEENSQVKIWQSEIMGFRIDANINANIEGQTTPPAVFDQIISDISNMKLDAQASKNSAITSASAAESSKIAAQTASSTALNAQATAISAINQVNEAKNLTLQYSNIASDAKDIAITAANNAINTLEQKADKTSTYTKTESNECFSTKPLTTTINIDTPPWSNQPTIVGGGDLNPEFHYENQYFFVINKDTSGNILPSGQYKLTRNYGDYSGAINQTFYLENYDTGDFEVIPVTNITNYDTRVVQFKLVNGVWKHRDGGIREISHNIQSTTKRVVIDVFGFCTVINHILVAAVTGDYAIDTGTYCFCDYGKYSMFNGFFSEHSFGMPSLNFFGAFNSTYELKIFDKSITFSGHSGVYKLEKKETGNYSSRKTSNSKGIAFRPNLENIPPVTTIKIQNGLQKNQIVLNNSVFKIHEFAQ